MTKYLLTKTLNTLYYYCRNRVLTVSFYDASQHPTVTPVDKMKSRVDLATRLPEYVYKVALSSGNVNLQVYRYSTSLGTHVLETIDHQFNINTLEKTGVERYIVYNFEESIPFERGTPVSTEDGSARYMSECIRSDAMMYINTFRLLGDSIAFTLSDGVSEMDCFYIQNKVHMLVEGAGVAKYKVTDLYTLSRDYPTYTVIDFVAHPHNLSTKFVGDRFETCTKAKGLRFIKE